MLDVQTVAVFGAGGKVGRRVVDVLGRRGIKVRALVHRTAVEGEHVTSIQGSVTDPAAVTEVVRSSDAVVQLATMKEDPETFFDVCLRGTFNILEAAREHPVRQVLLFSGDAVMGIWFFPQPIPIDEQHPLGAYPGYYSFSKVIEEAMLQQYAVQYDVPGSILRSSWVFDDDDILNHFSILKNVDPAEKGHGFGEVPQAIVDMVEAGQERIPILTDGQGVPFYRHIVHIEDVMHAFDKMLGNESAVGQSFNIAAASPFDYRVAADYLSQKTGVATVEVPCPQYHSFSINISKARTMLGYDPQVDIFGIIDRALEARAS